MNTQKIAKQVPLIHFSGSAHQVLVTGATGFIGQRLVRALLANGHRVLVLSRNPDQANLMFDGQVKCIRHMQDLPADFQLDAIINLAGARILGWRWTPARQAVLRQSRIDLTDSVVTWIARAQKKPRLLLSTSAIGFYGIQKQGDDATIAEDGPTQPIFMSKLCQDWEAAARKASQFGVDVSIMRFGLVLGAQGALPMMTLPIKLGLGGRLGSGKQWLSWIHVDDLLRGIAFLFGVSIPVSEKSAVATVEIYNFVAPEAVSQLQFSRVAAELLQRPCFLPTPAFPMRCVLGEQADLLLEGQRVVPAKLQQIGFQFTYPELRGALANLLSVADS